MTQIEITLTSQNKNQWNGIESFKVQLISKKYTVSQSAISQKDRLDMSIIKRKNAWLAFLSKNKNFKIKNNETK